MPSDTATAIAYVGALVALVGGGVGLFNTWKAVQWKRAELANSYVRDFNSNEELVFAGRCLDWFGGRLAVPEKLRPYLDDDQKSIDHDRRIFREALRADLTIGEMYDDPRIQLYRVAIDSFLTWLGLIACALDRKLFSTADIEDVGYWVAKIQSERDLQGFISAFGYETNINNLIMLFRSGKGSYRNWWFPSGSPILDTLMMNVSQNSWRGSYTFPNKKNLRREHERPATQYGDFEAAGEKAGELFGYQSSGEE